MLGNIVFTDVRRLKTPPRNARCFQSADNEAGRELLASGGGGAAGQNSRKPFGLPIRRGEPGSSAQPRGAGAPGLEGNRTGAAPRPGNRSPGAAPGRDVGMDVGM